MKNWNYIEGAKVGNAFSHGDEVLVNSPDWKGMAVVLSQTGSKVRIYSSDGEVVVDEKDCRKVGNAKIKYTDKRDSKKEYLIDEESGDLEVWVDGKKVDSLKNAGEGWKKYVETHATKTGKVGNADVVKDGSVWVVLYAEGTKSKEFKTEAEAKKFASEVGNETLAQYVKSKPRVINEDKTGAEEFFKQLSDDAKKREKKDDEEIEKVGNQSYKFYGEIIDIAKTDTNTLKEILDELRSLHEQGDFQRAIKDELNKRKTGNKVGNAMVGNYSKEELLKYAKQYGDKELIDHIISGKMTQAELGARTRWFQYQWDGRDINGKIVDKEKAGNKTGNALQLKSGQHVTVKDGGTEYDVKILRDNKDGTYEVKTQWGGVATIRESDIVKVGNKVGNARSKEQLLADVRELEKYIKDHPGQSCEKEKRLLGEAKEELDKNYGVLVKNSASDDKFAYVMREFDEGKLKTPDGKVVTDPAQAKAIAYSESKKTENGLARARKAMNAWNSERKIEPVGKYREFIDNLKNAIELGVAGVLYNSLDEQTVKAWTEQAKKDGYGAHISGVQGKRVILK